MKCPIHSAVGAIFGRVDSLLCQPLGWPACSGRLLAADSLQGLYYCFNQVALFAKVRENLLNIHITIEGRSRINLS
jgi:hypothetical protein